jgi:hypothetical protein
MSESRKTYPSDVTDDEWSFVATYLALLPAVAGLCEADRLLP